MFYNQKYNSLIKHIASFPIIFLWCLYLSSFFSSLLSTYIDFNFLYRENTFTQWKNIVIVKVDNKSLDKLQGNNDFRILTLWKTVYSNLINKLEWEWVSVLWFDIIFANKSSDSKILQDTLWKYKNIVIWTKIWEIWETVIPLPEFSKNSTIWTIDFLERNLYVNRLKVWYLYNNTFTESFWL